jgi:hypothetical protein
MRHSRFLFSLSLTIFSGFIVFLFYSEASSDRNFSILPQTKIIDIQTASPSKFTCGIAGTNPFVNMNHCDSFAPQNDSKNTDRELMAVELDEQQHVLQTIVHLIERSGLGDFEAMQTYLYYSHECNSSIVSGLSIPNSCLSEVMSLYDAKFVDILAIRARRGDQGAALAVSAWYLNEIDRLSSGIVKSSDQPEIPQNIKLKILTAIDNAKYNLGMSDGTNSETTLMAQGLDRYKLQLGI